MYNCQSSRIEKIYITKENDNIMHLCRTGIILFIIRSNIFSNIYIYISDYMAQDLIVDGVIVNALKTCDLSTLLELYCLAPYGTSKWHKTQVRIDINI